MPSGGVIVVPAVLAEPIGWSTLRHLWSEAVIVVLFDPQVGIFFHGGSRKGRRPTETWSDRRVLTRQIMAN